MRRLTLALLATAALAGCAGDSGVATTPTFAAARFVPQVVGAAGPRRASEAPTGRARPALRGNPAVASANRGATVVPDSGSMRGGTWFVDAVDPTRIYQLPLKPNHVTTVLLPPGERFNGAVGGDASTAS